MMPCDNPPEPPLFAVTVPPVPVELPGEKHLRVALPVDRYAWFLDVESYAIELDAWSTACRREALAWKAAGMEHEASLALVTDNNDKLVAQSEKLRKANRRTSTAAVTTTGLALLGGLALGAWVMK